MKVIFLDIDGVLNSEDLRIRRRHEDNSFDDKKKPYIYDFVDENAVNIIVKLCKQYNVGIVISSSWRLYTLEDTMEYFHQERNKMFHPLLPYVIDITPHIYFYTEVEFYDEFFDDKEDERGKEIQQWLNDNPNVEEYCILDDCNNMLENQQSHLILINSCHGLTEDYIDKIKSILKVY